jgi:hypothetical protein
MGIEFRSMLPQTICRRPVSLFTPCMTHQEKSPAAAIRQSYRSTFPLPISITIHKQESIRSSTYFLTKYYQIHPIYLIFVLDKLPYQTQIKSRNYFYIFGVFTHTPPCHFIPRKRIISDLITRPSPISITPIEGPLWFRNGS